MFRFLIHLWVLVLFDASLLAGTFGKPIVPAMDRAELQERLTGILMEGKVPGMAIALANRGGVIWTAGLGKADVAAGRPTTEDTLFRIGSISKTFVALAVLKLVEEGRLSLDAPVRSLVPEVKFTNRWEATDPVRVVHLLEHTTGWDDIHYKEYIRNDPRPPNLAEALALGPESRTSRWRPGTRFSYCNAGPAVTAAIVEKITGQRFEDYVEATFFKPIGMPTADFFNSPAARALLTNLYNDDGRTPIPYANIWFRPSGSINASSREMGAYVRFLLRRGQADGVRILSEPSIQRMETPATDWGAAGGIKVGYGLHNYTSSDDRGFNWHGHGGEVEGGLSFFGYLPKEGVGFFVAINSGKGRALARITKEVEAYLTKSLEAPVPPPAQQVPSTVVKAYTGWYAPINPRLQTWAFLERILMMGHVTFQGNGLQIKPLIGPPIKYLAVDGMHFRTEKGSVAQLVLMETPDGRLGVETSTVFAKLGATRAWVVILLLSLFLLAMLTVPLFALIWGTRWAFRRMRGVIGLHVRVLPLLAWLAMLALTLDLGLSQGAFMGRFGQRTAWSLGLTALTLIFAALSLASLWAALKAPRQNMNRWAYYHSLCVATVFVVVSAYLAWNGFIGFRSWI